MCATHPMQCIQYGQHYTGYRQNLPLSRISVISSLRISLDVAFTRRISTKKSQEYPSCIRRTVDYPLSTPIHHIDGIDITSHPPRVASSLIASIDPQCERKHLHSHRFQRYVNQLSLPTSPTLFARLFHRQADLLLRRRCIGKSSHSSSIVSASRTHFSLPHTSTASATSTSIMARRGHFGQYARNDSEDVGTSTRAGSA